VSPASLWGCRPDGPGVRRHLAGLRQAARPSRWWPGRPGEMAWSEQADRTVMRAVPGSGVAGQRLPLSGPVAVRRPWFGRVRSPFPGPGVAGRPAAEIMCHLSPTRSAGEGSERAPPALRLRRRRHVGDGTSGGPSPPVCDALARSCALLARIPVCPSRRAGLAGSGAARWLRPSMSVVAGPWACRFDVLSPDAPDPGVCSSRAVAPAGRGPRGGSVRPCPWSPGRGHAAPAS
jgi:hypothetical protein